MSFKKVKFLLILVNNKKFVLFTGQLSEQPLKQELEKGNVPSVFIPPKILSPLTADKIRKFLV